MTEPINENRFRFTDRAQREWDLSLSLLSAQRVDASDFSAVFPGETSLIEPSKEFLSALTAKSSLIAAVAWAIVKPQADKQTVDEEAFVDAIDGKALKGLKEAFWRSLADFFQEEGNAFLKSLAAQKEATRQATQMIEEEIEAMGPEFKEMIESERQDIRARARTALGIASGSLSPAAA